MDGEHIVFGKIGQKESANESPVEHPNEPVPNFNFGGVSCGPIHSALPRPSPCIRAGTRIGRLKALVMRGLSKFCFLLVAVDHHQAMIDVYG